MHLFYLDLRSSEDFQLRNEEHHHCVHVLRHKTGDVVHVTDGLGGLFETEIIKIASDRTHLKVLDAMKVPPRPFTVHIGVCPTKQMERMEWMVEKACEMGVDDITFLQSQNSERPRIRLDRLERKTISALKQSKGTWKTRIHPINDLADFIEENNKGNRLVAVVSPDNPYLTEIVEPATRVVILIGPEGDFTQTEVSQAIVAGFRQVSLGQNVLRTETAAIAAVQMVNTLNRY